MRSVAWLRARSSTKTLESRATSHHSIVEFQGKWYLFYHDSQLSGGQTHLRNIKVTELTHRPDGTIVTIDAYRE